MSASWLSDCVCTFCVASPLLGFMCCFIYDDKYELKEVHV